MDLFHWWKEDGKCLRPPLATRQPGGELFFLEDFPSKRAAREGFFLGGVLKQGCKMSRFFFWEGFSSKVARCPGRGGREAIPWIFVISHQ